MITFTKTDIQVSLERMGVSEGEGTPNLDDCNQGWLKEFASFVLDTRLDQVEFHKFMYPQCAPVNRAMDVPNIFNTLAAYALSKDAAKHFREKGFIADAMNLERFCETLYSNLPGYARW